MFPLLIIGALVIGSLTFWAAIQNWMADVVHRAETQIGVKSTALQGALVTLDRVMVTGQRMVVATARAVFQNNETVTHEEARTLEWDELPEEVRTKLETGQPVSYELSLGSLRKPHDATYKLVVRRTDNP